MRIFRRKKFEREMQSEFGFHLDAYIQDLVCSGIDPAEAQRRARVEFGGIETTKEDCRQAWGLQWIDELRADLRYTLRNLRRNPTLCGIAILSLALGIGVNTAIFGLVEAVILRTLPVRDPASLVFIQNEGTKGSNGGPPYPYFDLLRRSNASFEGMAAFSPSNMEVVIDGSRELVRGVYVSGNFYNLLGVPPVLGRSLSASDDQTVGKGGPDGRVVVISRSYWLQRFGGSADVIGRKIPNTIIGVMPSEMMSLEAGRPIDIAVPMMLSDPVILADHGSWWLDIVARLKLGVRPERAQAESNSLFQSYMAEVAVSPEARRQYFDHIKLTAAGGGMDNLRRWLGKPLTALLILAGLVLLASCVTVANLLLARATARHKEFAVRLAIGAGKGRLVRQTLTEALVLVTAGAALGLTLAIRGEAALAAYFATGNQKIVLDLSLNSRVLLFTLAVSALTGLAFGVLPAVRAVRIDPAAGLQGSSRSVAGHRSSERLGRALVVLQVALSMVLLGGAALFVHSLRRLESINLGFTRQNILTLDVAPERALYGSPRWLAMQAEIVDAIHQMPGVKNASWSSMTPLNGRDRGVLIDVPGFTPGSEADTQIHLSSVSPDYLPTYGIPTLLGRAFTNRDGVSAAKVALLNEAAARFYFGDVNPVGKKLGFLKRPGAPVYEIAGVVGDVKHQSVRGEPWRFIYLPIPQSIDRINRLTLSVRCSTDAMAFATPIVRQVRAASPSLLVTNISTIDRQVEHSLINERLVSALSTAFGALALTLACIGLYGVLAHTVTRRTSEIGIRMALGANRGEVISLILRQAVALVLAGIALGAPAVIGLSRISRALLFGVDTFDLPAFLLALLVLLAFAVLAGFLPARRAGRLDPATALRCD